RSNVAAVAGALGHRQPPASNGPTPSCHGHGPRIMGDPRVVNDVGKGEMSYPGPRMTSFVGDGNRRLGASSLPARGGADLPIVRGNRPGGPFNPPGRLSFVSNVRGDLTLDGAGGEAGDDSALDDEHADQQRHGDDHRR